VEARSVSLEPFEQFADLLAEAMFLVSGAGVILAANRSVANRLGLDSHRLRGQPFGDLIPSTDETAAQFLHACARTRETIPGSFDLVRSDGTTIACHAAGALLRPRSEDADALIAIRLIPKETAPQLAALTRKIDELDRAIERRNRVEKELREQHEWLSVTLASIGDAVIATDTSGLIMFMNPVAERLTGWPENEALGVPLDQVFTLIDETTRQPVESALARVLRSGAIVGLPSQSLLIARDGSEIAIDDSAAPIGREGGKIRGVVLVFHTIEERRRLERALRLRADELARADRQKNEFLAMLAHELRNPMAPINNALQVLRLEPEESQSQGREAQREADLAWAIEVISRQIRQMGRLVDDLLDVSRMARGKVVLRRERIALEVLVAHAVESVQPLVTAKSQELSITLPEEPLVLNADPARLEQVLCNLLNNAVKYTNDGGRIELVAALEDQGRTLTLRVSDNGIGIAQEVLPSVFELFQQADHSLDRSQGGLGIGLTLVRTLVELHGGSVEAASGGIGKGSAFTMRLPVASAEWTVKRGEKENLIPFPNVPAPLPTSRPRRILVVDDMADSSQSLARLLRRWGHDVSLAPDGASALTVARSTRPEVILLDIGLPDMDGYEVARQLRLDQDGKAAALVALTGYDRSPDPHHTRDCDVGFDAHLTKPVDLQALRELLATIEPRTNRHAPD
jgi:PAS domain S-box-containing protein